VKVFIFNFFEKCGSTLRLTAIQTDVLAILRLWSNVCQMSLNIKMKRNRSLNTPNGLLAKMESSYVTTCFGLHLWPSSGYNLVALRVYTICLKVG